MVTQADIHDEAEAGRGRVMAAVIYVLYVGSVMAVVTAPLGMLMAWLAMRRADAVARNHMLFQLRTFWLGLLAGLLAFGLWHALGLLGLPSGVSWGFGYAFFTLALVWLLGRCAVGIRRLMSGQPLDNPSSVLFGGRI